MSKRAKNSPDTSDLLDTSTWGEGAGKREPRSVSRFLKLSLVGGLVVTAGLMPGTVGAVVTTSALVNAWNSQSSELPPIDLPGRTKVTVAGVPIAQVFTINRVPVSQAAQGKTIRDAVVAIEDARFYTHGGVDPIGTTRALLSNTGGVVQGGSTITQQLAKNLRLTRAVISGGGEATAEDLEQVTAKSWERKVAEAHLALLLESRMTKDEILTNYLNIAYFGSGAYGIQAAAIRYFSVPANKLTLAQASMLAGILQSPVALDPQTNPQGAMSRRTQVISAMLREHMINRPAAAAANATPIKLTTSLPRQGCARAAAEWASACDAAIRELKESKWLPKEARGLIETGGLTVELTLDPKTQADVNEAAAEIIPSDNRVANAITMVEPATGEIKALGSNRSFGNRTGQTEIPLNTTQSFAPASTFKLFTLVAALEKGIPLSTVLPGGSEYTSSVFENPEGGYHNAEGLSESNVSISRATEMSINTAYVQLMEQTGVAPVADAARRLGITSIGPPGSRSHPGATEGSFTLGSRDVSVKDMAGAYAAIANHGRWCQPTLIKSVTMPNGKRFENTAERRCRQAVDPAVADTAAAVLKGVIDNGTGKPADIGRPAAGKTGTGEDAGSAWFAGFTPEIAAAVWTGDPRSPNYSLHDVMGYSTVYGGTLPASLWRAGMTSFLDDKPVTQLPGIDPAYLLAPGAPTEDRIVMPDVRGQSIANATAALTQRGLRVEVAQVARGQRRWVARDVVVEQSQEPGVGLPAGSSVTLSVIE